MPLIVICGNPCCGKTFVANKLKEYFEKEKNYVVNLINEESLKLDKNESYKNSINEKNHRSQIKSEVEKNISDKTITIVDTLNYIKGNRYEFYCLVRNSKTRHCVIYIKSTLEKCLTNNKLANEPYSEDLLKDLFSRLEEPIQSNRWDCPLYTIYPGEEAPYNDICISLFEGKKAKDPVSTKEDLVFDTNYLYNLDKTCQDIINDILTQQDQNSGDIIINITNGIPIYLNKKFTPIQLKKIKIEFIKISKNHPPKNKDETIKFFAEYLKTVQDRY